MLKRSMALTVRCVVLLSMVVATSWTLTVATSWTKSAASNSAIQSVSINSQVPGLTKRFLHKVEVGIVFALSTQRKNFRATVRQIVSESRTSALGFRVATIKRLPEHQSPATLLNLSQHLQLRNVSTILFLSNSVEYGRRAPSLEYFMRLLDTMGIPVIAWSNAGLEQRAAWTKLQLSLCYSVEHEAAAILNLMQHFKWHRFSILATHIAGSGDFIKAMRDAVVRSQSTLKLEMLHALVVSPLEPELKKLASSGPHLVVLFTTREEARRIMATAARLRLNGIHHPSGASALRMQLSRGMRVLASAADKFVQDMAQGNIPSSTSKPLTPQLSCDNDGIRRSRGKLFFRYLQATKIEWGQGLIGSKFHTDGSQLEAELEVLNLQPQLHHRNLHRWAKIGLWRSTMDRGSEPGFKDVILPKIPKTAQGVPGKLHFRTVFLEEPPYITVKPLDPTTDKCQLKGGVHCRVNNDPSGRRCCYGFCIDLLQKLAKDIGFTFDLFRVKDGKWGALKNGQWNGLVATVLNDEADLVMTSFKINHERVKAIDFSLPFLDTGVSIVVAKRTGAISSTTFLKPFDYATWMLLVLIAIVVNIAIFMSDFIFRKFSEVNNSYRPRLSLCRTVWLVWAVFCRSAVKVDIPRSTTARFLIGVVALSGYVVHLIYTCNLAFFMVPSEEFFELSGIEDVKLQQPYTQQPPLRFGTIPDSNTDVVLRRHFPTMHGYMKKYNRSLIADGIQAVKNGSLDAFLYDATVLDYLAGLDPDSRLVTVGSWYAMAGYGVGFPRNFKYKKQLNSLIMDYDINGDLERLRNFWLVRKYQGSYGPASPAKQLDEVLLADLLLWLVILVVCTCILHVLQHVYVKWTVKHTRITENANERDFELDMVASKLQLQKSLITVQDEQAALIDGRGALLTKYQALVAKYQVLLADCQANRQALLADRRALLVDRQALLVDRQALLANRQALLADRQALLVDFQANRQALLADRRALLVDRQALLVDFQANRQALLADRRALLVDRQALLVDFQANRQALLADRRALLVDRQALLVDRQALLVDRQALLVDRQALLVDFQANRQALLVVLRWRQEPPAS